MCFIPGLDPLSIGAAIGLGGGTAGGAAAGGSGFGTALQALGVLASVGGTLAGAQAQKATSDYNAKVAENTATADRQRAAYEAGLIKDRVKRTVASQISAQAGNGLNVQQGTPVAVLGDTTQEGELDVLARLYGGEASARASINDANRFRAEGQSAMTGSTIGAGSTLLTGLGKLYRPLRAA